ncbi:E2F-associated phosphoprotein [Parasteatoda tepidariorum]|uniref:E2F-associated phosphoprotein n=1 Tax=Parasteatoda tepidariorum TaxID=114398 RepID=UPI00077FD6D2|nr:E2F-associated phosphoprotein [Parasteatoda tepidariorum]
MEDEYVIEEFSEDEYNSSSSEDDDIQTFIKKEYGLIEVEDDFEAEVDKVMTAHLQKLKSEDPSDIADPTPSCSIENDKTDDKSKKTQAEINDELFYDPNMDDDDEKWINDKRRSYIFPTKQTSSSKVKPLPNSDAVLNCPACLSLLCLDCQRHDIYKSQYRAMFVTNCTVIETETLNYPNKKKAKKTSGEMFAKPSDVYNPVKCSICNTEVAVYDTEEIYHFFNVIASY